MLTLVTLSLAYGGGHTLAWGLFFFVVYRVNVEGLPLNSESSAVITGSLGRAISPVPAYF